MAHRFRPHVYCTECDLHDYNIADYKDGQDCPECDGTVLVAAPT